VRGTGRFKPRIQLSESLQLSPNIEGCSGQVLRVLGVYGIQAFWRKDPTGRIFQRAVACSGNTTELLGDDQIVATNNYDSRAGLRRAGLAAANNSPGPVYMQPIQFIRISAIVIYLFRYCTEETIAEGGKSGLRHSILIQPRICSIASAGGRLSCCTRARYRLGVKFVLCLKTRQK
jgi:hypothetical protein